MQIELCEWDPNWEAEFESARAQIVAALGPDAGDVHHVGSTSVPGQVAKPTVDIVLAVSDSADEEADVPAL